MFFHDDQALVRVPWDWEKDRPLGSSQVLTTSGWGRRLEDGPLLKYLHPDDARRHAEAWGFGLDDPVDRRDTGAGRAIPDYRSAVTDALGRPMPSEGPVRVWLDDDVEDRAAPEGWVHVVSAREACLLLATGWVSSISLDHDLGALEGGGDDPRFGNGHQVIDFLDEQAGVHGRDLWPWELIQLHTANAAQRDSMARALLTAGRRHGVGIHEIEPAGTKRRFRRAVTEPGSRQIRDGSGD